MQANTDPFIKKFNILDGLCRKLYPSTKGYSSIRKFADTLSPADRDTLMSIIKLRNTIHDKRNLVSIESDCLYFLNGLIRGLQNGIKGPIDADLENLKASNVAKMSRVLNENVSYKIGLVSPEKQEAIRNHLRGIIERERRATNKPAAFAAFSDFFAYYKNIGNLPEVREAKLKRRQENIERAKKRTVNSIKQLYAEALEEIEEASIFKRFSMKKKAKHVLESYLQKVKWINDYDELDDLVDEMESELEEILDS